MITEKNAVYMSMSEFEHYPKKKITSKSFRQKPDTITLHWDHFLAGKPIFIKPTGRKSWI